MIALLPHAVFLGVALIGVVVACKTTRGGERVGLIIYYAALVLVLYALMWGTS